MPSIYDAIRDDHARHRDLLKTIDATEGATATREAAFQALYHDIKSHSAAEEETFYSKLMQKTWGQDMARHSVAEHHDIDDILEELREKDMSSPGWIQRFRVLKHDYEHHMDEEEADLFTRAREVIGAQHNDRFGADFLKRKAQEEELIEKKRAEALEE
ncbi:hemerythrin domain-containing protein [Pseudooceanicola sp. CBS1P-1]|uniref:Hemerythrin domain-containing protein n=1 Tax=Pseudooceanicola albus TaxID=2692189 RepID=A0A6L7G3J2_9RHOB|nr:MULTISPECIES: hemerythrin domain-containing protein [Pseudooceanicola]MBT9384927.1 hemerythrin domain-containing protein [Pseudooceanicola endophyticus]MXN18078.1 hemerythrin domain-containing protein [Pseudooceanicola albus]